MRFLRELQVASKGVALIQRRWNSTGFAGIAGLHAPGDWAVAAADAVSE